MGGRRLNEFGFGRGEVSDCCKDGNETAASIQFLSS
jgi:hypothetical protein